MHIERDGGSAAGRSTYKVILHVERTSTAAYDYMWACALPAGLAPVLSLVAFQLPSSEMPSRLGLLLVLFTAAAGARALFGGALGQARGGLPSGALTLLDRHGLGSLFILQLAALSVVASTALRAFLVPPGSPIDPSRMTLRVEAPFAAAVAASCIWLNYWFLRAVFTRLDGRTGRGQTPGQAADASPAVITGGDDGQTPPRPLVLDSQPSELMGYGRRGYQALNA